MTLRNKFLIPTILMIILGLGASTLVSQQVSKSAFEKLINDELLLMAESSEQQLESWLVICKQSIVNLSEEQYSRMAVRDTFMGKASRKAARTFLLNRKEQYGYFDAFCIIDPNGIVVASSNPESFLQDDISEKPYFSKTLNGETVITDIIKDQRSGTPVFIISVPIYEREAIVGVVSGHIKFNYFSDNYLSRVNIGKTGHVIICNSKGIIVYHPESDMMFDKTLQDLFLPSHIGESGTEFVQYTFKGIRKHGAAKQFKDAGWTLLTVVEVSDIMKPVRKVSIVNLCIIALCLMVAIGIVLSFTKFVTKPLQRAIDFAQAIQKGDFSQRMNINTNDEIGRLSIALEDMAEQLHLNVTSLATANRELRKEREIAEAANQAKSDFLANMSHEIRTPMNAIMGLASLILKTDLTPKQLDYLIKIDSSAKSLLGIINDILDFSKIEANKLAIESINFDLNDVMNNIASMISIKAAEKEIEFITTIAWDVPRALVGDPLRLGQILINLANNAVKFTDEGQILIQVALQAKTDTACTLRFSVSDTGIGMSEKQMANLFDAFSQVDSSITRKFGGTGLGLSISKHLVEMMDGEISANSQAGAGSTFFFTVRLGLNTQVLKRTIIFPEDLSVLKGETGEMLGGAKILLVEDNPINQQVATEILKGKDVTVHVADNGKDAVDAIGKEAYDLVLMDIQMPVMGGYEATTLIRKNEKFKDLPIVAMTAHAMAGAREQCIEAGMNDYVTKPIDNEQLFSVLAKWIGPNKPDGKPGLLSPAEEFKKPTFRTNEILPVKPFRETSGKEGKKKPDASPVQHFKDMDVPGIDLKGGLARLGGNQPLYRQLLIDFVKKYASITEEIKVRVNNGESHAAEHIAHEIKGTAGNLSAVAIHAAAAELEKGIRRDRGNIDSLLSELNRHLRVATVGIRKWEKENDMQRIKEIQGVDPTGETNTSNPIGMTNAPKSITQLQGQTEPQEQRQQGSISMDLAQVEAMMQKLALSLAKNEADALSSFESLKGMMLNSSFREALIEMETHLDNFDFDAAMPLLQEIAKALEIPLT